jgi:hypothetical protein
LEFLSIGAIDDFAVMLDETNERAKGLAGEFDTGAIAAY